MNGCVLVAPEAKIAQLVLIFFLLWKERPRAKLRPGTRDSCKDVCSSSVYFPASQHTEHWHALCKNLISGDFRKQALSYKVRHSLLTQVIICIILFKMNYCCERRNRNIYFPFLRWLLFKQFHTNTCCISCNLTLAILVCGFFFKNIFLYPCPQCRRSWFHPCVRKIPWRKGMATHSRILAWEFHGQRSLAGYNLRGCKALDMTEWLTLLLLL